jgi:glycine oxidase
LLGRLLAWQLARAGHRVSVFDPASGPEPTFDGKQAAAFTAAGMLSPLAELDSSSPEVATLGWRSLALWPRLIAQMKSPPPFAARGSVLLAHRSDLASAQRVLARLAQDLPGTPRAEALTTAHLSEMEPAKQGAAH